LGFPGKPRPQLDTGSRVGQSVLKIANNVIIGLAAHQTPHLSGVRRPPMVLHTKSCVMAGGLQPDDPGQLPISFRQHTLVCSFTDINGVRAASQSTV